MDFTREYINDALARSTEIAKEHGADRALLFLHCVLCECPKPSQEEIELMVRKFMDAKKQ